MSTRKQKRVVAIRVEGRRLQPIRMSPAATAVGLGLVVLTLVAWVLSALFVWPMLGYVATLSGLAAMILLALHTWKRLLWKGRVLFGLPAVLVGLGLLMLPFVAAPWPLVFGGAGAIVLLLAVVFGVTPRAGMVTGQLNMMRAAIDPSLMRREAPGEAMTLRLEGDALELGDETWRLDMIAAARLDAGARPVLRVRDRIGDEVAVELEADSLEPAKELVARLTRPAD